MEKSLLVIDTPHETCHECRLCFKQDNGTLVCAGMGKTIPDGESPDWCPLIPLPEKQVIHCIDTPHHRWMKDGWNLCLSEIMKIMKNHEETEK